MSDVLVALGNPRLRKELAKPLNDLSYEVAETSSFFEARRRLRSGGFKLLFTEARLEDGDGRRLARRRGLRAMLVTSPDAKSENGSVPEGFIACVAPPFDANRIRDLLSARSREAPGRAAEGDSGVQLLGESEAMQDVVARLNCMAPSNAPVLITGETGTGKEVAARKLHELSRRSGGAFVAVNCGAISPSLMESQLFGHERGSFTGATRRHRGVFERADRGTLFLDEVTEMPAELQVKLLRALEGGEFHRTGGEEPVRVDVRILAATNRDVEEAVSEGRLRKDLYYRLKVLHLFLPPLRERGDDVGLLAESFLDEIAAEEEGPKALAEETMEQLMTYCWPGNVRELRNAVHSAYLLSEGRVISPDSLPREVLRGSQEKERFQGPVVRVPLGTSIREAERRLILSTLDQMDGNRTRTAKTLGISAKTLYTRLNSYKERAEAMYGPEEVGLPA
jgi:DNA-binding NtrC family response regulator